MIHYLDTLDRQLMLFLNHDGGAYADLFWYWFSAKWTWIPLYVVIVFFLWKKTGSEGSNGSKVQRFKGSRGSKGSKGSNGSNRWLQFLLAIISIVLVITLADQLSSHLIKPIVCRLRPAQDPYMIPFIHIVNNDRGYGFSFVSSHAANTWALTVCMAYIFRKRWVTIGMSLWALTTCYSRIYLGVHYPGDVLCGTLLGLLSALLVMHLIYRPLLQKLV